MGEKIKNKKWIAVYTRPRHEKKVTTILNKKGFKVYLPLLKKRKKWSDRTKWVEFPLFKSYLFVYIELNKIILLLDTPGLTSIVKFGNSIAVIQDKKINAIKLMMEGGFTPEPLDYFICGDSVKVINGPLKGLVGEVIRKDRTDYLIIRIDAIQHSLSVKINRAYLSKL